MATSRYHVVVKRTLIQFDEDTYEELRRRAFEQGRSISSLTRTRREGPEGRKDQEENHTRRPVLLHRGSSIEAATFISGFGETR